MRKREEDMCFEKINWIDKIFSHVCDTMIHMTAMCIVFYSWCVFYSSVWLLFNFICCDMVVGVVWMPRQKFIFRCAFHLSTSISFVQFLFVFYVSFIHSFVFIISLFIHDTDLHAKSAWKKWNMAKLWRFFFCKNCLRMMLSIWVSGVAVFSTQCQVFVNRFSFLLSE